MGLLSVFSKIFNREEKFKCFICHNILPISQKNGKILGGGRNEAQVACKKCLNKFFAISLLVAISEERELNIRELGTYERNWNAKSEDDPNMFDRKARIDYENYLKKIGVVKTPNGPRHESDPDDAILYNSFELNNERVPVIVFNCGVCKEEVVIKGEKQLSQGTSKLVEYFMTIPRIETYTCSNCNNENRVYKWVY